MKNLSNPQGSTSVKIKIRGVFTVYIVRLTLRLCTPCPMVVYAVSYALEGHMHWKEQQESATCHVTVPSARPAAGITGITKTMECSPLGSVYWEKTSWGLFIGKKQVGPNRKSM